MSAKRSGSYGDSQSVWLNDNWIDGLLKQKVRKIIDTTQVVPKHEVPILINREKNSTSGYWDHPINRIKPNTADMKFVDYFDFDKLGYRNFEYYQVRIVESSTFPDLSGRYALVSPQHVSVFINKNTGKIGDGSI